jgi:hypothetical protein
MKRATLFGVISFFFFLIISIFFSNNFFFNKFKGIWGRKK